MICLYEFQTYREHGLSGAYIKSDLVIINLTYLIKAEESNKDRDYLILTTTLENTPIYVKKDDWNAALGRTYFIT